MSVCLLSTASAHADRDIVYAARYYTPPGSHRTSHFHLYRINPDGTGRTQLTYGNQDDTDPHWSPDGRRVAFVRDEATVCVAGANGSDRQDVAVFPANDFVNGLGWLPDGRTLAFIHYRDTPKGDRTALWLLDIQPRHVRRRANVSDYTVSPDGHRLFLEDDAGLCLLSLASHLVTRLSNDVAGLMWLDGQRLVGVIQSPSDSAPVALQMVAINGWKGNVVTLRYPKTVTWAVDPPDDDGWLLPSPHSGTIIWALNEHNSTVGTLAAFFQARLADGNMRFLTEGQFLIWSPEGRRFCTAPGRDTWTYKERKWDGTYRTVWAAPLQTGMPGGKLKTVTPGLVWVTAADWRKRQQ